MEEELTEKKSRAWIWILVVLVILLIGGVVAYFLLSGNGGSIIPSGNSIPQPPALPSG